MSFKKNFRRLAIGLILVIIFTYAILARFFPFPPPVSPSSPVTTSNHPVTQPSKKVQTCANGKPASPTLTKSNDSILRKLAEYETVCKGAVTDTMMLFTPMPAAPDDADEFSHTLAIQLKEFAKHHIKPLVLFEPDTRIPNVINDIRDGGYDNVLTSYFKALKQQGVTDKQMGTWVLFPEANTPAWNNTNPETFAKNVTRVAAIKHSMFPSSHTSLLLNYITYPSYDDDWSEGKKKDLRPYLAPIPDGTIDSFGYQGFPYIPPATKPKPEQLNAKKFLPTKFARSAAEELSINKIWINTGTFGRAHTKKKTDEVTVSPTQRQDALTSIADQVKELQSDGFKVSVNLFNEDKSDKPDERIDWSYWSPGKPLDSASTAIFRTFTQQLREQNADLWLYDSL